MSQEPEKTTAVEPEQDIVQALDDKGKSEEVLEAPAAPEHEEPKEEEASEEVPVSKSCGSCCETCPNKLSVSSTRSTW